MSTCNLTGWSEKTLVESHEQSKRRKSGELCKSLEPQEIIFAKMKLWYAVRGDAARVLEDIHISPKWAIQYQKAYLKSLKEERKQLSPMQALFIFAEA